MPYVEVWVDDPVAKLEDADDNELIAELKKRGYVVMEAADSCDPAPLLDGIWDNSKYVQPVAQIDLSEVRHKLQLGMRGDAQYEALCLVDRALGLHHALAS